jgi:hypothetical protein
LVQIRGWNGTLLEGPHPRQRHVRSLCYVCHYRLVIWDLTDFLRVENAHESTDEDIRDPSAVSWIFVGVLLSSN